MGIFFMLDNDELIVLDKIANVGKSEVVHSFGDGDDHPYKIDIVIVGRDELLHYGFVSETDRDEMFDKLVKALVEYYNK